MQSLKEKNLDGCFDIEIVLDAKIHPLVMNEENSFTGIIKTKGVEEKVMHLDFMSSFDNIWESIRNGDNDVVYIVW